MTTQSDANPLCATRVRFAYDRALVVYDASLTLDKHEMIALAGPNGSGKTTLLRLLGGAASPASGSVTIGGRTLSSVKSRERARFIAMVPQHVNAELAFKVDSLVAMGRTPHRGLLGAETEADRRAVEDALISVDAATLSHRRFSELSGGEQQRVILAMALAQETEYLLLDEPTVHLDLYHQRELLELLRRLHQTRGVRILAVMHDLNLSALYFDRLAVMSAGHVIADAPPDETLAMPDVMAVFRTPVSYVQHPRAGVTQILLDRSY